MGLYMYAPLSGSFWLVGVVATMELGLVVTAKASLRAGEPLGRKETADDSPSPKNTAAPIGIPHCQWGREKNVREPDQTAS